ncbi:MAG: CotH kinase family protein, partial [Oscillospiraceae bacterium]|nr:CotH kinase family protein [Oscillospiraceae bacterium]
KYAGHKDRKFDYDISFSEPAGLYTDGFTLQLTTKMPDATIHYTTDGSEPTINSPVYSGGIDIKNRTFDDNVLANIRTAEEDFILPSGKIFKGTTIKAKAFDTNGNATPTFVSSYFVSTDIFTRYGVSVVSITTPEENLFDSETGIYVPPNYTQKGSDWEREAYMEVFDTDGNCTISQTVGLRINGAFTRIYQQKSLRVYARENTAYRNGDSKKFKYDFFGGTVTDSDGEVIDTYKTIILRNAGDDWYNYFIRDGIVQKIAEPLNVDTLAYTPAVVFINGEYWGVHEIRERYDDNYFESHYNLADSADVAMVEISDDRDRADLSEGEESDLEDFNECAQFVIENDMSVSENYQKACSLFDIDNLIDYYAVNIYFENNDWPYNNIKIWKNKNPENDIDGRWRWVLSDTDGTFQDLESSVLYTGNMGRDALKYWNTDKTGTLGYILDGEPCLMQSFVASLLKNNEFRERFKTRYTECINNYFSYDVISPIMDEKTKTISSLRKEHIQRYPNSWNMPTYTSLYMFANSRAITALNEIENYFK